MNNKHEVARLIFEREDDMFVAFLAKPDTMEGRHPMGSIGVIFAEDDAIIERFSALMSDCANQLLQKATGQDVETVREDLA